MGLDYLKEPYANSKDFVEVWAKCTNGEHDVDPIFKKNFLQKEHIVHPSQLLERS